MAMSEAQKKAYKKYAHSKKGKKARQKTVWKSHTKGFIEQFANADDLKWIQKLVADKSKKIKSEEAEK